MYDTGNTQRHIWENQAFESDPHNNFESNDLALQYIADQSQNIITIKT